MPSLIYDFAIIGAGPVGLYIAKHLDPSLKLIIVEAGGENPSSTNVTFQNPTSGNTIISPTSAFGLGGGLNLWGGRLVTYQPRDFKEAQYDYKKLQLDHYYKEVGQDFNIKKLIPERKITDDLSVEQHYVYNKDDFLNSLKKTVKGRVRIAKNSKVLKIKKSDKFILSLDNGTEIIAQNVIVACGSLETHRLLYRSNFVSRHISYGTHPKVTIGEATIPSEFLKVIEGGEGVEKGLVFANVERDFNMRLYSQFNLASLDYLLNRSVPKNSFLKFLYENIYFLKFARKIYMYTNQRILGTNRKYKIRIFFDQNEDEVIMFDSERLVVSKESTVAQKLNEITSSIHKILLKNGFKNLNVYPPDVIEKNIQYVHSHFTGGMAASCDDYGQMTSVEGLYICSASLLPYKGYANPTYTLLALAKRLTDFLNK
jgi:hypothetical protein